jgi:hypothetical protein
VSGKVSRRALLGSTAAAITAAAAMGRVSAQETPESQKIKQSEAHYQHRPKGQQRCAICLQFEPPARCKIVQGPIGPQGWCQFFAARDNAH